jgi:hypothetical protein
MRTRQYDKTFSAGAVQQTKENRLLIRLKRLLKTKEIHTLLLLHFIAIQVRCDVENLTESITSIWF